MITELFASTDWEMVGTIYFAIFIVALLYWDYKSGRREEIEKKLKESGKRK